VDGDEADDFKFLLAAACNFDFVADLAVEKGFCRWGGGRDETFSASASSLLTSVYSIFASRCMSRTVSREP